MRSCIIFTCSGKYGHFLGRAVRYLGCSSIKAIHVSFKHTWLNVGVTILGSLLYVTLCLRKGWWISSMEELLQINHWDLENAATLFIQIILPIFFLLLSGLCILVLQLNFNFNSNSKNLDKLF